MISRLRKIVDWIVGLVLIAAGIIGGFVPILQGWVLVLAGLAVLSSHSVWAQRIYASLKGLGRSLRSKMASRRERAD